MSAIANALTFLVASVFVVAALIKLRYPLDFRREVSDYHLLPRSLLVPLAAVTPPLELAAAVLTVVPSTHLFGVVLLLGLLTLFSAVVAISVGRGVRSIHCACFGQFSRRLSWAIPARNALLAAPLAAAIATQDDSLSLAGFVGATLAWTLGWLLVETMGTLSLVREGASG